MFPASSPSTQRCSSLSTSRPSRRAVIAAVGTATMGSLAGCSALETDADEAPFHGGDWLSYGNDPTNANRVGGGAPAPDEWRKLASGDWSYAPPVVMDGVVYYATDRTVVAVTPDRSEVWGVDLPSKVTGASAIDPTRDRLYVPIAAVRASDDTAAKPASVVVLSLSDGEILERLSVGGDRTYGVTVSLGDVCVRSAVACVRFGPDGDERWRCPLDPLSYEEYKLGDGTATQVAPAVTDDGVYVPDRDALVKIDPSTGQERWRVSVDTPYAAPVVGERGAVQTGWQEIVAVDHAGDVRWRRDLHSRAAAGIADDGEVYVAAGDLYALDGETGETNWQSHLPSDGTAAPVVTDEAVVVATGDVRAFRREVGTLLERDRVRWTTDSVHAAAYSSPVIAAGHVFVVGPTGLVALGPAGDE